VKEQHCDMCGKPAEPTPFGAMLCPICRARNSAYRCTRCGGLVTFGALIPPDHPDLVSRVCWTCRMKERADAVPVAEVEAIRATARGGKIQAIKLARERLGWSLIEAAWLVEVYI